MSQPSFNITNSPERLILAFQGRLDSAGCAMVAEPLLAQVATVAPAQVLRFDLAGSDFVASAFLRLCIRAAQALGGERFELANLVPSVREVFAMAGLDRHLRIVDADGR